jgi:transposase
MPSSQYDILCIWIRTHICPFSGYVADRDVNAAKNILKKAVQARAWPSGTAPNGEPVELRSPQP